MPDCQKISPQNSTAQKIRTIEELAGLLDVLRAQDGHKKIVQCHGVFDLLHIGHIRHFEEAKRSGDFLVVTVTPDRYVNKGPHRPAFGEKLRAEAIAALDCVDYVAVSHWPTAVQSIILLKPSVYAKGADYKNPDDDLTGKITDEEAAVKSLGGEVLFTDDIVFSSSELINRHIPVLPAEANEYLAKFKQRYSSEDVIKAIESTQALSVLVLGETIIDEYRYCEQMGKSAKEPILAVRYVEAENFAGGVLAIANHVASFCENVSVLTFLGSEDTREDFVREHLKSNVEPLFLYQEHSPTIVKTRFIESYFSQKLFEVYQMKNWELTESESAALCAKLTEILPNYDLVIIADYGHGMMSPAAIQLLCEKRNFLAVNTQANAGNKGFNTVSKYPRADFISLSRDELEIEERNYRGPVPAKILDVATRLNCSRVLVTLGRNGTSCYSEKEGFFEAPALSSDVVDRMGAGDAVLSLTSMCALLQVPMEILCLIANAVGAQAAGIMGNRHAIDKIALYRHIDSLLK